MKFSTRAFNRFWEYSSSWEAKVPQSTYIWAKEMTVWLDCRLWCETNVGKKVPVIFFVHGICFQNVFHKCRIVSLRKCHVAKDNICSQSQHGYRWIADLDWCKFKADDEWIYRQKKYCITRDDDQPRQAIFVRSYSQKFPMTLIQNEPSSLSRRLSFLIIC